jgi:glycosyltransferase involved in cell wall biosynthesis
MTPKISIITVCFNAAKTIDKTIKSVIAQDYPNIEYIIIDGASQDNTLEILDQYDAHIDLLVSEPDKNTFDAMNKGLRAATGEYIWYVHADDQIASSKTLSKAMANHNNEDFLYGKALIINESGETRGLEHRKKHPNAADLNWKSLRNGMIICHQAMLVRTSICPEYDMRYPLVGDLDWTINILKKARSIRDTGVTMCQFVEGGISTKYRKASLRQRFSVLLKHYGLISTLFFHFLFLFRALKRGSMR